MPDYFPMAGEEGEEKDASLSKGHQHEVDHKRLLPGIEFGSQSPFPYDDKRYAKLIYIYIYIYTLAWRNDCRTYIYIYRYTYFRIDACEACYMAHDFQLRNSFFYGTLGTNFETGKMVFGPKASNKIPCAIFLPPTNTISANLKISWASQ